MIKNYFFKISVLTIFAIANNGCAYFNTYYNANLFFQEAEDLRITNENKTLSGNVKNAYKRVIAKTDILINKYDKSKFVDDAYFLKGQSHYHIGEYDNAVESFSNSVALNPEEYQLIVDYWLALIKWKTDKQQPALNDLEQLIEQTDDDVLLAKIYKSQAEIYLDLDQDELALNSLEQAAQIAKDRVDRSKIHFELAELADEVGNYEKAIDNYENVIKYSISNDQILESHLRIVQKYREAGDYKEVSNQIQNMLNKPDFAQIYADLNLELAKLYFSENGNESAIAKLDDIVVQFPKTEVSAEAFYFLGEEYISNLRDFEKAEYYYQQVSKEYTNSDFSDEAKIRLKEISQYNAAKNYLNSILINQDDNGGVQEIDTTKIVEHIYILGELEAFHFDQLDTSMIHFNKIIANYPDSDMAAKALYTLSIITKESGDTDYSLELEKQIIDKYPDSEYAEHLRATNQNMEYGKSSLQKLKEAEQMYLINKELALQEYMKIGYANNSEAAIRALLFLANEYESKLFIADSASKYYSLITKKFPDSEQAKVAQQKLDILSLTENDNN